MKILKYELKIADHQLLPIGPRMIVEPLSVAEQKGKLILWAMVTDEIQRQVENDDEIKHEPIISIYGTGNPFHWERAENKRFIGTVLMSNGLVWHVFSERMEQ